LLDHFLLKVLIHGGSKGKDMEFQSEEGVSQQQGTCCVQKAQMHCTMVQNAETECYTQNAETLYSK